MSDYSSDTEALLKAEIGSLKNKVEELSQALHDRNSQIKTLQSLQNEYQDEIKYLQGEKSLGEKALIAEIQQIKEAKAVLKNESTEKIKYLENELDKKDEKIADLADQLKMFSSAFDNQSILGGNDSALSEVDELQKLIEEKSNKNEELEKLSDDYRMEIEQLRELTSGLKAELVEFRETFACQKQQLGETNALVAGLKDENLCLQSEISSLKCKPLDVESRGNSLFAEVNDRRLKAQEQTKQMKGSLLDMHHRFAYLQNQNAKLTAERGALVSNWEAKMEELSDDNVLIVDLYKSQIAALKQTIESYKTQFVAESWAYKEADGEWNYHKALLKSKDKELEKMREELSTRATNLVTFGYDLRKSHVQCARLEAQLLKSQSEIENLKAEIKNLKYEIQSQFLNDPAQPPNTAKEEVLRENVQSIMKKTEDDARTSNVTVRRNNVKFSEEANDCEKENKFKRGVKVHVSNPVRISSKKPALKTDD